MCLHAKVHAHGGKTQELLICFTLLSPRRQHKHGKANRWFVRCLPFACTRVCNAHKKCQPMRVSMYMLCAYILVSMQPKSARTIYWFYHVCNANIWFLSFLVTCTLVCTHYRTHLSACMNLHVSFACMHVRMYAYKAPRLCAYIYVFLLCKAYKGTCNQMKKLKNYQSALLYSHCQHIYIL